MQFDDENVQDINENGNIRVLLVEDDLQSGKAMDLAMGLDDINVHWVVSAEEALEFFDIDKYDAIVADIRLGGASGVELLRAVRLVSESFPVILLTAYNDMDAAMDAVKLGAQDYIMKPLENIASLIRPLQKEVKHYRTVMLNQKLQEQVKLHYQQVKDMNSALILAEEHERRKLAVDLHDSIAQLLTASLIQLEMAEDEKDSVSYIQMATRNLEDAVDRTRSLTLQLSSNALYTHGLKAALSDLAESVSAEYGLTVECEATEERVKVGENGAILLYRTVRELLLNVVKHANASLARLEISHDDKEIVIRVIDDGVGFEVENHESQGNRGHGIGLYSIRDRLDLMDGRFEIISEPGKGVNALVAIPLSKLNDE